ncbi:MAG: hypothetical protein HKO85_02780 [Xanthomonadales bacterium]|nr:hypothetical protein [Gammaproteobacteria bacterium]NNL04185.1 hypothetical protein [Xanthomonadales bacterium]
MNFKTTVGVLLAVMTMAPGAVLATNTVIAGEFDGAEERTAPLPAACSAENPLAYQNAGTFQVAATGTYVIFDVFNFTGVDITAMIYEGGFDPANPASPVTPIGIDWVEQIDLTAGVDYTLVVQNWCQNQQGAWALTFSGPGNVTSGLVRAVPEQTQGLLTNSDPVASTECNVAGFYKEFGPIRVQRSGTYHYTDISVEYDVDVCLQVYTAPFDPSEPDANRVGGALDDFEVIDLEADTDYYFVLQSLEGSFSDTGEYFYVLAPPAPFRINKALAGAWYNSQTSGQGLFMDVYDNINQMFVGWYTFDLSRPVDGTAQLGEPGHRWLTAFGPIDGPNGDLDVFLAKGGAFDSPSPAIDPQEIVGSMTVEFDDCMSGTVNYALTDPVVAGEIPIQPLAADHVELCETLTGGPGMPGPL